jgi:hypothetical protein
VSRRQVSAFVDALVAGRRPRRFRPGPEEAAVLGTAIELRAARPGEGAPDEQFVSRLYEELAEMHPERVIPMVRPDPRSRWRVSLVSVAAGLALVGGTVAATEEFDRPTSTPAALAVPRGQDLRTATFEDVSSQDVGQIVVYGGSPSWVFMTVKGSSYDGPVTCMLQTMNGSTLAVGAFALHGGTGELAKTIRIDIGRLRSAQLVTSTGATLASASFA